MLGQVAVTASIDFGLANFIGFFIKLTIAPSFAGRPWQILLIYGIVLALHGMMNTFGVKLVAVVNDISVWWHLIGTGVIVVVLFHIGRLRAGQSSGRSLRGRPNAYSLLDDGVAPESYRISVLHRPDGSGGSRWLHERRVGDLVSASVPRSAFAPVAAGRHHLLIAGGIGITPLLSHAHAAHRWRRSYTLLYRYRSVAHLAELRELCGSRLINCTTRYAFAERCADALVHQPLGTHLYVCGPAGSAAAVLDAAGAAGWPAIRLHAERFSADVLDAGRPFRVRVGAAC